MTNKRTVCEVWYESVVVCISACEGMGVCLRGSASGRVRLCWDSQLFHGAVPGSTAGLVGVYWQPVCVCLCVCIFASFFFRLGVGPLLFDHSSSLSQLPSHDSSSFEFHYIKQRLRAMFVQ